MSITLHTPKLGPSILIEAAQQLGYNYKIIDHDHSLIEISLEDQSVKFFGYYPNINDAVSTRIAKNKYLCSKLLHQANVPTPRSIVVTVENLEQEDERSKTMCSLKQFSNQCNKRIVIKPLSLLGGKGVSILPNSDKAIIKALTEIRDFHHSKAMIEEYVSAKNEYRLLAYKNQIIDVVQRFPPMVTGDGFSSIEQLLLKEQKRRTQFYSLDKTLEAQTIRQLLSESKIKNSIIPKKNQQIQLSKKCNFSLGGGVKKIWINTVHNDYVQLLTKIHNSIGINYYGVDLMASDITKSLESDDRVNEINENPGLRIHAYADYLAGEKPINVAVKILKLIFH